MIKDDEMLIVPAEMPPSNSALTTTIKPQTSHLHHAQVRPARIFRLSHPTLKERVVEFKPASLRWKAGQNASASCLAEGGALGTRRKWPSFCSHTSPWSIFQVEVHVLLIRFSAKFPSKSNLPPFSSHQKQLVRQTEQTQPTY